MFTFKSHYPSVDGNPDQREELLSYMTKLVELIDNRKSSNLATFTGEAKRDYSQYWEAQVPHKGIDYSRLFDELDHLIQGNPHYNHRNYLNAIPVPAIPSILGMLTTILLNNNSLWDIFSPSAAEAELKVTAMMASIIGYDPSKVGGYFTYGGQGGIQNGLRVGIEKAAPGSRIIGIPDNLYCIASDKAHFSIMKAVETGIGTNQVVLVKTNPDSSINLEDLEIQMNKIVASGGKIALVLATTGTTDTFGMDHVGGVKDLIDQVVDTHKLEYIPHLHVDGAMGGIYVFFKDYDFDSNPLGFDHKCRKGLKDILSKIDGMERADSLSIDFHKLGQCPYNTSIFMVKDARDLQLINLNQKHCPYIGNHNYGDYFTSYTIESSRMGSAIAAYCILLVFGIEGFQELLAHYLKLTNLLKEELAKVPYIRAVSSNPGPLTLLRAYPDAKGFKSEFGGVATANELKRNNEFNENFIELLRQNRQEYMFGDTNNFKVVQAKDTREEITLNAFKVFYISSLTSESDVRDMVKYLSKQYSIFKAMNYYEETKSLRPEQYMINVTEEKESLEVK